MNHLIIDGFNMAYRAHHTHPTLTSGAGNPSGCFYGFLVSLKTIKKKYQDCHITIAWDTDSTRRKSLDPTYKANREHFDLTEQIHDLKIFCSFLNVSQSEYQGEEADDVMASLVKKYSDDKNIVFILTSDKDILQLVRDGRVLVIRPKKMSSPERVFDEAAVKEEFGVGPDGLMAYLCFRGDSIDNIPGVSRVKSARITSLIHKYKTPREIYAHLNEEKLTDFERASFKTLESRITLNEALVRLRGDLVLDIKEGVPSEDAIALCLTKYNITSINPNAYINTFVDVSSFKSRTAPAVQCFSLFD